MLVSHFMLALSWAMGLSLVSASIATMNSNLKIRNAPGIQSSDTISALRRALSSVAIQERDTVLKNSTSLDRSWNGAVLFSYEEEAHKGNVSLSASVEIVCTTCYIKGTATAQFTVTGDFNVSQAFHNVTSEVKTEIDNITTTTIDDVENYVKSAISSADFHIDDLEFPPIQVNFDVDVPKIPECELRFQFDGMELYMQVDTILSGGATYTLNLYTSKTPIGIAVDKDLTVGVVVSIDLILSVESEIDISSGFHIKLHDGVAIDIAMFGQQVSSITFNGGNFEFLPVTVQSAGVVLTALLRVGVRAGLELGIPTETVDGIDLSFSAGVEVGVWADVAQFTTNVTATPNGDSNGCELRVVEEYSMLLGANAGATLAILEHTWGPTPETQIPIWYTTLANACAVSRSATAAASAAATVVARDDLTTKTTSTKFTYTATGCLSTGLVNCPVSLQSTSKYTVTTTLVTAIPSGSTPTFPASTQDAVVSTIAFGANARGISATSGTPISYIPPSPSTTSTVITGETGGVSNKLIIGISVGVGVPVLLAIVAGCICCCRRHKRSASIPQAEPIYVGQPDLQTLEPYTPGSYMSTKKSPNVTVIENHWRT